MRKSPIVQPHQGKFTKRIKPHRVDSNERFSSFETPPGSEAAADEFSDFETPRTEEKFQFKDRSSGKKERSLVLSKEVALNCEYSSSSLQKSHRQQQMGSKKEWQIAPISLNRDLSTAVHHKKGEEMKENCQLRYNYPNKMQGSLSTIKEDLRQSDYSSLTQVTTQPVKKIVGEAQWKGPTMSAIERLCIQQQKIQILVLQEENAVLREKVAELELALYRRDEEKIMKKADSYVNRLSNYANQDLLIAKELTSRESAKMKLLDQIAILQRRCREMKQQMDNYKMKQERKISKLLQQTTKRPSNKSPESYELKFHEVFLNMIEKLPIDMDKSWTSKKKIAVGWKVVKYLIKKAMKLGIQPPTIVDKDDFH